MSINGMQSVTQHLWLLYIVHIVLSLLLATLLAKYLEKRYVKGGAEIDARDRARLNEIAERSITFKLFFELSLHKNNKNTALLFFFLFNIAIPLFGYILSCWIAWYLNNVVYEKRVINTNMLNLDEFGTSFLQVERIFGESSMETLLTDKYASKSKKLKALSSLANSNSAVNLRIIKQTLASTDDEIRMFGYAIINKNEKAINDKLNKYITLFHEANEPSKKAESAKELAFLYWEMIYTEISHESLRENFLLEVVKYLNIAKEFYIVSSKKNDETLQESQKCFDAKSDICIKLYVLHGRVYMYKKEYNKALVEFTIAQELNELETSYILPYLAEIYYLMGNYKIVKSIMQKSVDLGLNATLYPVISQWSTTL